MAPRGVFVLPAPGVLFAAPEAAGAFAAPVAGVLLAFEGAAGFLVCPIGVLFEVAAGFAAPVAGVLFAAAGAEGFFSPIGVFEAAGWPADEVVEVLVGFEAPEAAEGFRGPSLAGLGLGAADWSLGGSLSCI